MRSKIKIHIHIFLIILDQFNSFARLYKTYENLDAGQTYDALVDMSGKIIKFLNYILNDYYSGFI
jgi:hypothetical protein